MGTRLSARLREFTRRLLAAGVLAAGLGVVVWFCGQLVAYRWNSIQEVDTQGYIEIAKSFAKGQWPRWPDEFSRFRNHVWVDPVLPGDGAVRRQASPGGALPVPDAAERVEDHQVLSKYQPGWPLCLAVGYLLGGAAGAMWVNCILAMLGVIGFYLLARDLFGNAAAAICTFIWVTSPMVLAYVSYPLGHSPEITFTLWAFYATARWARTGRLGWAWAAGFCGGFMPLIRATTVLIWPALAMLYWTVRAECAAAGPDAPGAPGGARHGLATLVAWLGDVVHGRRAARRLSPVVRQWCAAGAGALLPLGFLLLYNSRSFGHPLRTGYFLTAEQQAFDLGWLAARLNDWLGTTWSGGGDALWATQRWAAVWRERHDLIENRFLLLCLLGLLLRVRRAGYGAVVLLWLAPTFVLYVSYYFFMIGPVFYRFVLLTLPGLILAAGLLFGPRLRRSAALQFLAVLLFGLWVWHAPPRFFQRRAEAARGEIFDEAKFPRYSRQSRDALVLGFGRAWKAMPTRDLEPWIAKGPVVVYARPALQWQAAVYPNVTAYDTEAWHDRSFARPFNARAGFIATVWGHVHRARRIHALVAPLGPAGLQAHFGEQVQRHLARGARVLVEGPDEENDHPLLDWADTQADWQVTNVYVRPAALQGAHNGLGPLSLWQIRAAPKGE